MAEIIKGTTPTITYTFASVLVTDIDVAILTIKRDGAIKIEKQLDTATVDAVKKTISWTLSQAETLSVAGTAEIMLNWLTEDGTRGATKTTQVRFLPNHKEEVITNAST